MPCFNAERYLRAAAASILEQSYADFELLVVDDGSDDATLSILEEFAGTDSRVRVESRPHAGIVAALNHGLSVARGELIARMDADDVSLPHRLQRQVTFLDQHPEVAAVGSWMREIDAGGVATRVLRKGPAERRSRESTGVPIFHPTAMIRRTALEVVGGYRPAFEAAEDADLWFRMLDHGLVLENVEEILVEYRIHNGNVSLLTERQTVALTRALLSRRARWSGVDDHLGDASTTLPAGTVPWNLFPPQVTGPVRVELARRLSLLNRESDPEPLAAAIRSAIDEVGFASGLRKPAGQLSRRYRAAGRRGQALLWSLASLVCGLRDRAVRAAKSGARWMLRRRAR